MTKRKSEAERENDARKRAAIKEWTKKLGHKPTPEDMQRALIAAAPGQCKHEKEEFERGKKGGYAWAESGRSIAAVERLTAYEATSTNGSAPHYEATGSHECAATYERPTTYEIGKHKVAAVIASRRIISPGASQGAVGPGIPRE
jgi:hypothetical protein